MIRRSEKERQQSRTLRKKGSSYSEIAKEMKIAKSTAKDWCKDIILSSRDRKRLYTKQIAILSQGSKSSHNRRQEEIQIINNKAEKEIKSPLSDEAYKLFGAALYWAEGNKVKDFTITNSDPLLIRFMCQWFCKMFDISPNSLKAHLNIYNDQNEMKMKKFWSDVTGIPLRKFGKSFIKPVNKNYKKNTLYYGTIKVRVEKGTDFRHRTFGWINSVLKNTRNDVENIEKKWYKLKTQYKRV
ncbi:MAG: hypothetical protein WCX27_02380 [Candidatus Paceibacterota bacterium]|jgi:hypothetical protein